MTYQRSSCLYREEPLRKNSEISRLKDAMLYVQDVRCSLEIRKKQIPIDSEKIESATNRINELEKIENKLVKIRQRMEMFQ